MLKHLGGIALKLALSGLVILIFLVMAARAPFFRSDTPVVMTTLPPLTGTGEGHMGAGAENLFFADANARFEGSFHALGQGSAFDLKELDVAGPCEGAGRRHLDATCPDCVITNAPLQPGQAATLFWSEPGPAGSVGTIFRDCSTTLGNDVVRVPLLHFNGEQASDAARTDLRLASVPVPLLENSERTSSMMLGNWAITVDVVRDSASALDTMGSLLRDAGWQELRQDSQAGATQNQRVYARDNTALCVVTLNRADEGYELVTMMNI